MVSLRCHKEPDLRADHHIAGKDGCYQVGLQLYALQCVNGIQIRHSTQFDLHTSHGISGTLQWLNFVMQTYFAVGMIMWQKLGFD